MTQEQRIIELATEVGNTIQLISQKQGDLATLTTAQKGTLVGAINELKTAVNSATVINDTTTSINSTWSSAKTSETITNAILALVNGSPESANTLKELADLITANAQADAGAVSFTATQSLAKEQKEKAQKNIGFTNDYAVIELNVITDSVQIQLSQIKQYNHVRINTSNFPAENPVPYILVQLPTEVPLGTFFKFEWVNNTQLNTNINQIIFFNEDDNNYVYLNNKGQINMCKKLLEDNTPVYVEIENNVTGQNYSQAFLTALNS
jgi:hypothetical protein